ncbi:hypothetical protein JCM3765_001990 [Sporobolomyces pararoseus]
MPFKAHSTLFYGVFVNSLSLCFAADAHEATKDTQLAIDMIKARKRRDQIHLRTPYKALARIPEEVWQSLRDEVIDQAIYEAEQAELRVVCSREIIEKPFKLPKNWEEEELSELDNFWEAFSESRGVERILTDRLDKIESLLGSFGLAFPLTRTFVELDLTKEDYWGTSAVALPMWQTFSASASSTIEPPSMPRSPSFPRSTAVSEDTGAPRTYFVDSQAIFSHSTFSLPPDVDTRFNLFFSRFGFSPINPAGTTFHPPGGDSPSSPESQDEWEDFEEEEGKEAAHARREHGKRATGSFLQPSPTYRLQLWRPRLSQSCSTVSRSKPSLCSAVDAHKATQDIQLALDIIKLRKQQGVIKVSTLPKTVTRIPEEVWQLIKEQVVDQALLDAEQAILTPFCGPGEVPPSLELPRHLESEPTVLRDDFWNNFFGTDGTEHLLSRRQQDIEELLSLFGLVLPITLPHGKLHLVEHNFESFSIICLPLKSGGRSNKSKSSSPYPSTDVNSSFVDCTTSMTSLLQFSHSAFVLPSDADNRFERFLTTFNLRAGNPVPPIAHPPSSDSSGVSTAKLASGSTSGDYYARRAQRIARARKYHEAICCLDPVVKPHWNLLTVMEGPPNRTDSYKSESE